MQELLNDIKNDKLIQKYLYKYTWLSGCSTVVYPITISTTWKQDKAITIQINTDKNYFKKLIERYKNKYKNIEHADFFKSDGSCPSRLIFEVKEV